MGAALLAVIGRFQSVMFVKAIDTGRPSAMLSVATAVISMTGAVRQSSLRLFETFLRIVVNESMFFNVFQCFLNCINSLCKGRADNIAKVVNCFIRGHVIHERSFLPSAQDAVLTQNT